MVEYGCSFFSQKKALCITQLQLTACPLVFVLAFVHVLVCKNFVCRVLLLAVSCCMSQKAGPDGSTLCELKFEYTGPGPCEPPAHQSTSTGPHANGPCRRCKRPKPLTRVIMPLSAAASS